MTGSSTSLTQLSSLLQVDEKGGKSEIKSKLKKMKLKRDDFKNLLDSIQSSKPNPNVNQSQLKMVEKQTNKLRDRLKGSGNENENGGAGAYSQLGDTAETKQQRRDRRAKEKVEKANRKQEKKERKEQRLMNKEKKKKKEVQSNNADQISVDQQNSSEIVEQELQLKPSSSDADLDQVKEKEKKKGGKKRKEMEGSEKGDARGEQQSVVDQTTSIPEKEVQERPNKRSRNQKENQLPTSITTTTSKQSHKKKKDLSTTSNPPPTSSNPKPTRTSQKGTQSQPDSIPIHDSDPDSDFEISTKPKPKTTSSKKGGESQPEVKSAGSSRDKIIERGRGLTHQEMLLLPFDGLALKWLKEDYGLEWKSGKFSKLEEDAVEKAIKDWGEINGFDEDDLDTLLFTKGGNPESVKDCFEAASEFLMDLSIFA